MKLKIILLILLFLYSGCASRKKDFSISPGYVEYHSASRDSLYEQLGIKTTSSKPHRGFLTFKKKEKSSKNHSTNSEKIYKMAKPQPMPEPKPEPKPVMDVDKDGVIDSEDPMPEILMSAMSGKNIEKTIPIKFVPVDIQPITQLSLDINSISKGDINYVVQDTMIVGVLNEVNMTISVGVNKDSIISQIKTFTKNNLHTESVRISPVMRARLIDPSGNVNFKIVNRSTEEQFLEYGEYTRWTWDVTPLNKGNNNLSIVVDIIFEGKSKTLQVYDGVIYVYSTETVLDKILNFLSKNWQYILSTLLLPFSIYLYNIYSKRKKDKKVE